MARVFDSLLPVLESEGSVVLDSGWHLRTGDIGELEKLEGFVTCPSVRLRHPPTCTRRRRLSRRILGRATKTTMPLRRERTTWVPRWGDKPVLDDVLDAVLTVSSHGPLARA
jgi:hypothetical protein